MAKSRHPLFSLSARGGFARSLIFLKGLKGHNVTFFHRPNKNVSNKQKIVRDRFYNAKTAWNALTAEQKEVYNDLAIPLRITGYNLFLSEFVDDSMKSKIFTIPNEALKTSGDIPFEILSAPGVNKMYILFGVYLGLFNATIPFEVVVEGSLVYGDAVNGFAGSVADVPFLQSTGNHVVYKVFNALEAEEGVNVDLLVNKNITFYMNGYNPINGDGHMKGVLFYEVVDL
jgi:hypothetical protein